MSYRGTIVTIVICIITSIALFILLVHFSNEYNNNYTTVEKLDETEDKQNVEMSSSSSAAALKHLFVKNFQDEVSVIVIGDQEFIGSHHILLGDKVVVGNANRLSQNEFNYPVCSFISITFVPSVNVQSMTVSLKTTNGSGVLGMSSFDGDKKVATFQTNELLRPGTKYIANVLFESDNTNEIIILPIYYFSFNTQSCFENESQV